MRIKQSHFLRWHLPLYFYLSRSYIKFMSTGKCLDYPLSMQVQTQSHCNGRCTICPYQDVRNQHVQGTMTSDLHCKIIDEVGTAQFLKQVIYELQNEPLLDKRIFDWVKHFKFENPCKETVIVTNGELLNQFNSEEIIMSKLDYLIISLNANSKEMFSKINCNLDYAKIVRNIKTLLANDVLKQKIILSFVIIGQNEREVYHAVQYWHRMGINTRVMELTNRAGTLTNYEILRSKHHTYQQDYFSKIRQYLMSPIQLRVGCSLPFYQINVLFNEFRMQPVLKLIGISKCGKNVE